MNLNFEMSFSFLEIFIILQNLFQIVSIFLPLCVAKDFDKRKGKGLLELECQTGGWSVSLAAGLEKKLDTSITCPESRNWR
jgi:hypothetical protein